MSTQSVGDENSAEFSAFVTANAEDVWREAFALRGDAADATALVRTVLGDLGLDWGQVTSRESPLRHARTELVRAAIAPARTRAQRHQTVTGQGNSRGLDQPDDPDEPDERDDTDDYASTRAERASVQQALAQLTARQRAALVLKAREGCSASEVADLMGCGERTALSLLTEAEELLSAGLDDRPRPAGQSSPTLDQIVGETLAEEADSLQPPWMDPAQLIADARRGRRTRRRRGVVVTAAAVAALGVVFIATRGNETPAGPMIAATAVPSDTEGAQRQALYQWASSLPTGAPLQMPPVPNIQLVGNSMVIALENGPRVNLGPGRTGLFDIKAVSTGWLLVLASAGGTSPENETYTLMSVSRDGVLKPVAPARDEILRTPETLVSRDGARVVIGPSDAKVPADPGGGPSTAIGLRVIDLRTGASRLYPMPKDRGLERVLQWSGEQLVVLTGGAQTPGYADNWQLQLLDLSTAGWSTVALDGYPNSLLWQSSPTGCATTQRFVFEERVGSQTRVRLLEGARLVPEPLLNFTVPGEDFLPSAVSSPDCRTALVRRGQGSPWELLDLETRQIKPGGVNPAIAGASMLTWESDTSIIAMVEGLTREQVVEVRWDLRTGRAERIPFEPQSPETMEMPTDPLPPDPGTPGTTGVPATP